MIFLQISGLETKIPSGVLGWSPVGGLEASEADGRLYKMLSYRRETALQGTLVLAKSGRLELGNNILGLSSTTVT